MWLKGLAKGFGAYVGNEMLLVSDSKRAYQLAHLILSLSLSLLCLIFISFAFCSYAGASGSTLGKISLFHIHHFTASVFTTKQVLSSLIHCRSRLPSNKLCLCIER